MRRSLPLFAAIAFALAACAGPAPVATDPVDSTALAAEDATAAAARFDAAVDAVSRAYFGLLPESATYNGAPDALAPGARARLNDRSPAGDSARLAELEAVLADLRAIPADALDDSRRRMQASLVTVLDGSLAPARVADYGSSFAAYGLWYTPYALVQLSGPTVDTPNLLVSQH